MTSVLDELERLRAEERKCAAALGAVPVCAASSSPEWSAYMIARSMLDDAMCQHADSLLEAARGLEHMKRWAAQDQDALTGRQLADAVMRMCDDALAPLLKEVGR